jgi:lysyl-tRNA synthetase class 1
MHWADKIAREIESSNKYKPYWVDDMKTPSGFAHVGSLRGPLIHSLIFRSLKDAKQNVTLTFVVNDFDPADELPPEFKDKLKKYLGFSLREVPSPDPKYDSLGTLIAEDFKKVLQELGFEAKFLSSYDLYKQGKFDEVIKIALDNAEKIQDIYHRVSGSQKKEKGWLPFQVVCQKCGKLGTTLVNGWDGKEVFYKCDPNLVSWATGCGYQGKISPFGGTGKLPWKVDWAAHWKVIGVTIEGAGKDHSSAGGSYDIAMTLCKEVFNYPTPFKLPYEWFIVGGKKMSSSKGVGFKAHDITKIFPPEISRFLFVRTDYKQAIDFDPLETMAIPDLFDEYDRCWQAFNNNSNENLSRAFELSQIKEVPKRNPKLFIPRFRDIANYMQFPSESNFENRLAEIKRSSLTSIEKNLIKERERYAKYWLENYAPGDFKITLLDKADISKLGSEEKDYLKEVIKLLESEKDADKLQTLLYTKAKEMKIDAKKAFSAIYLSLLGKDHGPKAAWFLLEYKKAIKQLKEALR